MCVREDRSGVKERFGGVAMYIRDGFPFCVRNDLNSGGYECLRIELIRYKCKPAFICCAYRAPNVDFHGFTSSLKSSVPFVDFEKSDVVILGNFNANLMPNSKATQER